MRSAGLLGLVVMVLAAQASGQGYVCAEGGGNAGKGAWAEEVFGWMVEKGKHGPAVIIGAVELDAADQPDNRIELFKKLGASSCEGLVIDEKNADSQEVYDKVAGASVVFIRGGAQERYVNWWKGTKTEKAIHAVFDKGGVVAGTSAGCAILGEVSYDSRNGSLKPLEALQDARHPHLTLTADFLGLVPGVLFDTHFAERGRLGRLPVMLATAVEERRAAGNENPERPLLGLGVDPRTAVCVGPDHVAEIKGEGHVTMLWADKETTWTLEKEKPPVLDRMAMQVLVPGQTLDLSTRIALPSKPDAWLIGLRGNCATGRESPPAAWAVSGSSLEDSKRGEFAYKAKAESPSRADEEKARREIKGMTFITRAWSREDHAAQFFEFPQAVHALWPIAVLLDDGETLKGHEWSFTVGHVGDTPPASVLVFSMYGVSLVPPGGTFDHIKD